MKRKIKSQYFHNEQRFVLNLDKQNWSTTFVVDARRWTENTVILWINKIKIHNRSTIALCVCESTIFSLKSDRRKHEYRRYANVDVHQYYSSIIYSYIVVLLPECILICAEQQKIPRPRKCTPTRLDRCEWICLCVYAYSNVCVCWSVFVFAWRANLMLYKHVLKQSSW